MSHAYEAISKQLAKLKQELMIYRYQAILKTLTLVKNKSKRIQKLEHELNKEIKSVIQNHVSINDLLDELEALI